MLYNRGMVPKATPSLLLENFRCFVAPREIPLAPLTFLVGENSSGKTSFLAAIRLAWEATLSDHAPVFSQEAFDLGGYEESASSYIDMQDTQQFLLGLILPNKQGSWGYGPIKLEVMFTKSPDGNSVVSKRIFTDRRVSVEIQYKNQEGTASATAIFSGGSKFSTFIPSGYREPSRALRFMEFDHDYQVREGTVASLGHQEIRSLQLLTRSVEQMEANRLSFTNLDRIPEAMAPVQSRPERIYNPQGRASSLGPEIMHLYFFLSTRHDQRQILEFGKGSGLFSDINIIKFGEQLEDPFQLRTEVRGENRNVIDVGYGVSQALPIATKVLLSNSERMILIQQPEVHLHPKAQAEMGTFFAEQMLRRVAPLIVETHSDYMIDRVRLLIRKGQVRKEDVQILFFSPQKTDVDIIPIELDDDGSIVRPPDDYRKFFLDEQFEFFS